MRFLHIIHTHARQQIRVIGGWRRSMIRYLCAHTFDTITTQSNGC